MHIICYFSNQIESDDYICANGSTIPAIWMCDGDNDCRDFLDEEYCRKLTKHMFKFSGSCCIKLLPEKNSGKT